MPINRPTAWLKTGEKIQGDFSRGETPNGQATNEKMFKELTGKCNEKHLHPSVQEKNIKAIYTYFKKLKVCILLYSAIPLLGSVPQNKNNQT